MTETLPILVQVPEKDKDSSSQPQGGEEGTLDSRERKEGKRSVIVTFRVSTLEAQVHTVPANITIFMCDTFSSQLLRSTELPTG